MAKTFDYKKHYKDIYSPKNQPSTINIPKIIFVAVDGEGNPNDQNGEYAKAIELLYGIQYTIKMSKKSGYTPKDYFDYVVPPLEGLWRFKNDIHTKDKSKLIWTSMIRLPEFVDKNVFELACIEVNKKKNLDTKKVKLLELKEGFCVQCMHIGSFDEETRTLKLIDNFIEENNLINDISDTRKHHEIYLSDPRKTESSKMRTILRIPVKNKII